MKFKATARTSVVEPGCANGGQCFVFRMGSDAHFFNFSIKQNFDFFATWNTAKVQRNLVDTFQFTEFFKDGRSLFQAFGVQKVMIKF